MGWPTANPTAPETNEFEIWSKNGLLPELLKEWGCTIMTRTYSLLWHYTQAKKKGILVCFTVSLPEIHPAINSTRGMAFGHRLRMTSTNAQDVAAEHYRRGNSPHVFDISPYHCKMLLCGTQIHNSPLAKVQWWENDLWAKIYKSTLMANV